MMKLAAIILALIPSMAGAAVCVPDFIAFTKAVKEKAGQSIIWYGEGPHKGDKYVIFSSPKTLEWTAVRVAPTGKACILVGGVGSKLVTNAPF